MGMPFLFLVPGIDAHPIAHAFKVRKQRFFTIDAKRLEFAYCLTHLDSAPGVMVEDRNCVPRIAPW
jgi:hypothetical protein